MSGDILSSPINGKGFGIAPQDYRHQQGKVKRMVHHQREVCHIEETLLHRKGASKTNGSALIGISHCIHCRAIYSANLWVKPLPAEQGVKKVRVTSKYYYLSLL